MPKAFQEQYSEEFSHCFGCGTLNEHGYHLKSYWEGETSVAYFTPKPYHTAIPGFVYGGLLASLIDCHSTGTGAAALEKNKTTKDGFPRCVTASLNVEYLKPTPIDTELKLVGRVEKIIKRRVTVNVELWANNIMCVKGKSVVVQVPPNWRP